MCPICGQAHSACKGAIGEPQHVIDLKPSWRQAEEDDMIGIPKRGAMAENKTDFIATKTLFLDKDGKVVDENNPTRLTKLVHAGGRLPQAEAVKYGLADAASATGEKVFTAPERIYTDKDKKIVGEKDPAKETLVVARGGQMPQSEAVKLGIAKAEAPKAKAKAPEAKPAAPASNVPVGTGLNPGHTEEKKLI